MVRSLTAHGLGLLTLLLKYFGDNTTTGTYSTKELRKSIHCLLIAYATKCKCLEMILTMIYKLQSHLLPVSYVPSTHINTSKSFFSFSYVREGGMCACMCTYMYLSTIPHVYAIFYLKYLFHTLHTQLSCQLSPMPPPVYRYLFVSLCSLG